MFSQFRHRYPQGSLIGELINMERGLYLVRVQIQSGGILLATGLAAAATVEQAEDRARERALEALALELPPKPAPAVLTPAPAAIAASPPHRQRNNGTAEAMPVPPVLPVLKEDPAPPSPVVMPTPPGSAPSLLEFEEKPNDYSELPFADAEVEEESVPDFGQNSLFETALPASSPPVSEVDASPRNLDFPTSTPEPPAAESWQPSEPSTPAIAAGPIDFSEIIAQTNIEMKRLQWTSEDGRRYLLQTYGKRSRQLLSDEELLEFWQYLKGQPNP